MRGVFWRPNPDFLTEISAWLKNKHVLEVFSGNGYLASELIKRGVTVRATSLRAGHDAHDQGFHCEVEEIEASGAVAQYGDTSDVLLICWPTVTNQALQALIHWGFDKPVVFIGEVTKPEMGMAGLGGCATDEFFEVVRWSHEFPTYKGNILERAGVLYLDKDKLSIIRRNLGCFSSESSRCGQGRPLFLRIPLVRRC